MKALSLTQPWATLVAIGAKKIETRSWSSPYRGILAIHASKGFPGWAKEYVWEPVFLKYLRQNKAGHDDVHQVVRELPLGKIVALAKLDRCLPTNRNGSLFNLHDIQPERGTDEYAFGDYSAGRYMWLLKDIIALPEPVPCKGALSLWDVPADIETQIQAYLEQTESLLRPAYAGTKTAQNSSAA